MCAEKITRQELNSNYTMTGVRRSAIFGGRLALMNEIFALAPIYVDESYYAHHDTFERIVKNGEHFKCGQYESIDSWRDCHYYLEYADKDGNKIWIMTGGRYD